MMASDRWLPDIHYDLDERFWSKVDKASGLGPRGDCWEWTACTASGGYGQFKVGPGVTRTAHRLSLVASTGINPSHLQARHDCDNPLCVNPAHLSWGTHQQNQDDKIRNRQRS